MLKNSPDNPFSTEIDQRSADDGNTYLSPDEYACKAPDTVHEKEKQSIDSIAGTYSGVWKSNAGVGGIALMKIVTDGSDIEGSLKILGSPLGYEGDDFIGTTAKFSDGI